MQAFATLLLGPRFPRSLGLRKHIKVLIRVAGPVLVILATLLIGFLAFTYLSTLVILFSDSFTTQLAHLAISALVLFNIFYSYTRAVLADVT